MTPTAGTAKGTHDRKEQESKKAPRILQLFHCPIYGININRRQCREQTAVVSKNERTCTGGKCASPWRLCRACITQGEYGDEAVVIDRETGLCAFHCKNGKEAKREKPLAPPNEFGPSSWNEPPSDKEGIENGAERRPPPSSPPVTPPARRKWSRGASVLERHPAFKEKSIIQIARTLQDEVEHGASAEKLAERFDVSQATIDKYRKFLNLHVNALAALQQKKINACIASHLVTITTAAQLDVLNKILDEDMSTKNAIALIANAQKQEEASPDGKKSARDTSRKKRPVTKEPTTPSHQQPAGAVALRGGEIPALDTTSLERLREQATAHIEDGKKAIEDGKQKVIAGLEMLEEYGALVARLARQNRGAIETFSIV